MPQILGLSRLYRESTPTPSTLDGLRAEIDRLDDALLDLIERRLAASLSIAELKNGDANGTLKFRPRREAAIIDRLIDRARRASPELVTHVWRELMSHSLQAQVRTELVLCATQRPDALRERVRERFGWAATTRWADTPEEALDIARHGEAVAAIEHSPVSHWWIDLADSGLSAFDIIRHGDGRLAAIVVGRVASEDMPEGPRPMILDEKELGDRLARGDAVEPISACGSLRLCLAANGEGER